MQYFSIATIREAIERLQLIPANWLLPAFVFAANDVGRADFVDLSERHGTDQFLDRFFNGRLLAIPDFGTGNNLLRPRLKGITWDRGSFAGDHMIRQNTKMWGNLFSSRGYREMRLQGLIEGEHTITKLSEPFQARFEAEVPAGFRFEDFMVWLFAFSGFPDEVTSWQQLFDHLLHELGLTAFQPDYQGRFRLSDPPVPWPTVSGNRPSNEDFISELAPKLSAALRAQSGASVSEPARPKYEALADDDEVYSAIRTAISARASFSFLLAGPPGTGKTRYARRVANKLTELDASRTIFLQFHPAIGYDDFVEGFRPAATAAGLGIRYELAPRLLLTFAAKAAADRENLYVVVIDELNRGDVARVFGELLTYIEPDYRDEEFTLPYSAEKTTLPPNLIIIATANPYDRSVTDLDDALLRRFWVIEMDPSAPALRKHLQDQALDGSVINRVVRAFEIVNEAMPSGFGHAAFLDVRSVDDLAMAWSARIRMSLKRALIHDRQAYDGVVARIEALLRVESDAEEPPA